MLTEFYTLLGTIEGLFYSIMGVALAGKIIFTISNETFDYSGDVTIYSPHAKKLFLNIVNQINKTADEIISKNFGEFSTTFTLEQTAVPKFDQILT